MGLERDADSIPIQCYAPLLANVNPADPAKGYPAWQWPTNLIGYDALTAFGSPSYYAQAMFGQNKGDAVLPAKLNVGPTIAATEPAPHGAVGVGTWHTGAEFKDIVVTAPDGKTLLTADLTKDGAPPGGSSPATSGTCRTARSSRPPPTARPGASPATPSGPTTRSASRPARRPATRAS